jgi:RNA recognition motif-containing protein
MPETGFLRRSSITLNYEVKRVKKLYVGNMGFETTESDLRTLFQPLGQVENINVITDRETGRARGFAFVEMTDDGEAGKAIEALNGKEVAGRALTVNEARPKTRSSFGGDRGDRAPRW